MSTSPHTTTCCDTCDSREWSTLADCDDCGNAMCDMCPGATEVKEGLICGACADIRRIDAMECECVFSGDQADASVCELHGARASRTLPELLAVCAAEREAEITRIQARLSMLLAQRKVT